MADFKEICQQLIADGGTKITTRVKNVNVDEIETDKGSYVRVSFTITDDITGYQTNRETGVIELGTTNVVYSSTYAIAGILKENENQAWMANNLRNKPNAINLILNGARMTLIQNKIPAGTPVVNPFSHDAEDGKVYDHDVYQNNIIGFELSKTGKEMAQMMARSIMGF